MPKKTSMDRLQEEIAKVLDEYGSGVSEGVTEAVQAVTKAGVKAVKGNARSLFNGSKYASGWTSQIETGRTSAQGVIYNAKAPGLPHLLEHGHVGRNGKRTFGFVPGREHIAPVEAELIKAFEEEVAAKI